MNRRFRTVATAAVALIWPLAACVSGGNGPAEPSASRSTVTLTETASSSATSFSTPSVSTTTVTEEVPATPTKDENESNAKQQRFEGTIRVLTIDELVAIHQEDPGLIPGAKGARFAVLELDTPTQAKVFYPYAQKIRQTGISMILMAQDYPSDGGRVAAYESMDGTRATMLVSADKLIFPPDPRPPRAEPMTKEFELER